MRALFLCCLLVLLSSTALAEQQPWNLPLVLNKSNASFKFEIDSTWVFVKGTAEKFEGQAYYANNTEPESLSIDLELSTKDLKTGLEMRDDHLYEIMAEDRYPLIKVKIDRSSADCTPEIALKQGKYSLTQTGTLTIRDVTKKLTLLTEVTSKGQDFVAQGKFTFSWADYNIEDPSNFFATVYPDVTVKYEIKIPN